MRLNLIGASGSGTSTLGRWVAEYYSIPHFESDHYYHGPSDPPFQNPRSPELRCQMVQQDVSHFPDWVFSGGIAGWQPDPQLDFTAVILLIVPTELRLQRLRQREAQRFGSRVEPGGDMYESHLDFLNWSAGYDFGHNEGKSLPMHRNYLQQLTCPVKEIQGDQPLDQLLSETVNWLESLPATRVP